MDSGMRGILGLGPGRLPSHGDSIGLPAQYEVWTWADPYAAILRFGGWTIDDIASDRSVAAWVRFLWKLFKESERFARQHEEENRIEAELRWREEGLPVPCPICESKAPCSCRVLTKRLVPPLPFLGFDGGSRLRDIGVSYGVVTLISNRSTII